MRLAQRPPRQLPQMMRRVGRSMPVRLAFRLGRSVCAQLGAGASAQAAEAAASSAVLTMPVIPPPPRVLAKAKLTGGGPDLASDGPQEASQGVPAAAGSQEAELQAGVGSLSSSQQAASLASMSTSMQCSQHGSQPPGRESWQRQQQQRAPRATRSLNADFMLEEQRL